MAIEKLESTILTDGAVIGPCRVLQFLGRGGMGEVYLAEHLRLETRVALKVLPPDQVKPGRVDRFLKEAKLAARINHPNVVTIHDVGQDQGHYYIVMQYVDGRNLQEYLRIQGGPLPCRAALNIARHAAKGVEAVHKQGLIHRDVKPANIMLSEQSRVLLMDFGLVRDDSEDLLTQAGAIVGTPGYMAPEQCRGESLDIRADVYALGATLYFLLTGTMPYERLFAELRQTHGSQNVWLRHALERIGRGDSPPSVTAINPLVPTRVAEVVMEAMAFAPERRPQSAALFASTVQQLLNDLKDSGEAYSTDTVRALGNHTLAQMAYRNSTSGQAGVDAGPRGLFPLELIQDEARMAWWQHPTSWLVLSGSVLMAIFFGLVSQEWKEKNSQHSSSNLSDPPKDTVAESHAGGVLQDMVRIPAGKVTIGDSPERLKQWWSQVPDLAQNPAKLESILANWSETAEVTRELPVYWIDRYEVTNGQYADFVKATGRSPPKHWNGAVPRTGEENYPVTNVSYVDAAAYAAWAKKSLPTVAQFVRAFRGDQLTAYPWGDTFIGTNANVMENKEFSRECSVMFTPRDLSPLQVYNLAGNVSEITRDKQVNRGVDMIVLKGADFHEAGAVHCLSSYRSFLPNSEAVSPLVGFRCVLEDPAPDIQP